MADLSVFKDVFDMLAQNGCLGNPHGDPAYGYLRVSTSQQSDEDRTGLPRQMQHIHEVAKQQGYYIAWDLLFADDHSGFEFQDRPELNRLFVEIQQPMRRANAVVIEQIDRLSRNSDWHQGYLLEQFAKAGVKVIFWKAIGSRIERAVFGAIAQDGMEDAKARMEEGLRIKARSGRVTPRNGHAAYGYQLVDSDGNPGEKARKDTHYGIVEDQARWVRWIFEAVVIHRKSFRQICNELNAMGIPSPRGANWEGRTLTVILNNPAYYGKFAANRVQIAVEERKVNTGFGEQIKKVKTKREKPEEEWILVDVPPIVSKELWDMAKRARAQNKATATRNGTNKYLLTGLLKCATCGRTFVGTSTWAYTNYKRWKKGDPPKKKTYMRYRCAVHHRTHKTQQEVGCDQKMIPVDLIDTAVWKVVREVLLQPEILVNLLQQEFDSVGNQQLFNEIEYLENDMRLKDKNDQRLKAAYEAGAYTPEEFAEERRYLRDQKAVISNEIEKKRKQFRTQEDIDAQKQMVYQIAEAARRRGLTSNSMSYENKRRIIRTVVNKIIVNPNEDWFTIEGVIQGTWSMSPFDDDVDGEGNGPSDNGNGPSKGGNGRVQGCRLREHSGGDERGPVQSRTVEEIWSHSANGRGRPRNAGQRELARDVQASCPECGAPLATNAKFCPECGAKLKTSSFCKECGAKLDPGAKFCGECGTQSGRLDNHITPT